MRFEAAMGFMTDDHRRVHHFVGQGTPRMSGNPCRLTLIAARWACPRNGSYPFLNDLEKHMTFLFRNKQGEVTWAYPVTVDKTPHHLTFSTGEQVYAA